MISRVVRGIWRRATILFTVDSTNRSYEIVERRAPEVSYHSIMVTITSVDLNRITPPPSPHSDLFSGIHAVEIR